MKNGNSPKQLAPTNKDRNSGDTVPIPAFQKRDETPTSILREHDNVDAAFADLRNEIAETYGRLIRQIDELDDRVVRFLQKYGVDPTGTNTTPTARPGQEQ